LSFCFIETSAVDSVVIHGNWGRLCTNRKEAALKTQNAGNMNSKMKINVMIFVVAV
jgi:hypothetical protein